MCELFSDTMQSLSVGKLKKKLFFLKFQNSPNPLTTKYITSYYSIPVNFTYHNFSLLLYFKKVQWFFSGKFPHWTLWWSWLILLSFTAVSEFIIGSISLKVRDRLVQKKENQQFANSNGSQSMDRLYDTICYAALTRIRVLHVQLNHTLDPVCIGMYTIRIVNLTTTTEAAASRNHRATRNIHASLGTCVLSMYRNLYRDVHICI